ncbi:hypothetical protein PG993_001113 [Apiospora rasikravindrae]|uniref:Uncharacterized protein n=1 Tax=Apiospora rasikravindrae TaxID=990691 RepID=A0ABR1UAG8_9PEZI
MSQVSEEPTSIRTRPRSKRINAADGAASGGSADSDQGDCVVPLDSTIYISILDPMGEPAFKPSPTKPIPKWMQQSSPQHRVQRQAEPRPVSILEDHFQDVKSASAKAPESPNTVCPTTPSPPPTRLRSPPRRSHLPYTRTSATKVQVPVHEDIPQISVTVPVHGTSFVTSPPLKRPSSRVVAQTVSEGTPPTYHSHQEAPNGQHPDLFLPSQISRERGATNHGTNGPTTGMNYHAPPPSRRSQTPSSEPGMGSSDKDSSPRSGNRSRTPIGNLLHRSSSPLAEAVISGLQRIMSRSRTPPPQSKEYLNLYKPTTAAGSRSPGARDDVTERSPSIGVAGKRRARRVEREEFDHMIRGQVLDAQDDGDREDEAGASGGKRLKTKRKSSLQVELRKLFSRGAT